MRMRSFGETGLKVSVLGFGALQIGDPALAETHVARVLNHVLDNGLTQMSVDSYIRQILVGAIIVLAVAASSISKRARR